VTWTIDSARFAAAPTFTGYLGTVVKHAELWHGVYRTSTVESDAVDRLREAAAGLRLLVLSEDWCGDCVSVLPVVARLAEQAGVDLRVLARDANDDIIGAHLTSGTKSIPVVIVLDAGLRELAWWGPRPSAVQRWYRNEGLLLAGPERGRRKRAWYARDRGRTTVAEVLDTVERAARSALRPSSRPIDSVTTT
jgi:thiol-disulfide isomerase/thioredoxin